MRINPDKAFVREMRRAIKDNNGFCPCMITKSPDTKCPCRDFREKDECHCGLYVNEEDMEKINMSYTKTLNIDIKMFDDEIIRPCDIEIGDWIDLRAAKDIVMVNGEFKLIPLGIAMKLPAGYEAHVAPRSSTFKNFGIIQTNSVGVVDGIYCGDNDQWFFPAYAIRDTEIMKNDRICQFRIVEKMPNINFTIVDVLGNKDRGGHGSTGNK